MQILQSRSNLFDSLCDVLLREFLVFLKGAIKGTILHVFHEEVDGGLVGEETVQADDVAVVEEVVELYLSDELLLHHVARDELFWDLF